MSFTQLKIPRKEFLLEMTAGLVMSIITVTGSIANGMLSAINIILSSFLTIDDDNSWFRNRCSVA